MATQAGKLKNGETQSRSAPFEVPGFLSKVAAYPKRWRVFLHEVRVEMRQVTWPTRHEVFVTTWVVLVTVAFFGIFFFGVDTSASWIVQHIIQIFKR